MRARSEVVLITAFEPFGSDELNSTEQVLSAIRTASAGDLENITSLLLPVDQKVAIDRVVDAIESLRPTTIVCLGQANGRETVTVEKVAINFRSYSIPDNSGAQPVDEEVVVGGPAAYFTTLPVADMVSNLREERIPVALSLSAGSYVCNGLFYSLMHHLDAHALAIRAGFVHLPRLPEQITDDEPKCMMLETQIAAIKAIVRTLRE